ncbi:MAG: hypothetical protein GY711_33290 [bacterium]|nr:hypothetical protein [bacterium]
MKFLAARRSMATAIGSLVLAASATGQSQTLVLYDPVGMYDSCATVFQPTSVATSISASPITQVGLGCWFNTNVWPLGQIGTSVVLDPNQYTTFDVVPNSTTVQYETLSYSKRSYVGEGPRQAAVRTSLDGFASDVALVTGLDPMGFEQILFDISSLPSSSGSITFRIYFFDAPGMGADWADLGSSAVGDTGLILTGNAGAGPIGSPYCGPAIPNSTAQPGLIEATGSVLVANNLVTLTASQLPPGQFGYFLVGQTQGFFNPPGSQGLICLTGNIGRYNSVANIIQGPTGSISIDLTAIPVNPPTAAMPGETWNFQCWYRDLNPTLTNNFTDGLTITFQ